MSLVAGDSSDDGVLLAADLVSKTIHQLLSKQISNNSPLGVTLSLGGLDLCLSLGVLFLTGGGEGRWLAGTSNGSVDGLDTASDNFLGGSNDRVELGC